MPSEMTMATRPPTEAASLAAARAVCRRDAKPFFYASVFLPRAKRDAVSSVYTFSRMIRAAIEIDDASEESTLEPAASITAASGTSCCSGDSSESRVRLVRDRLDAIYGNRVEPPLPEFRDETQHVVAAFAQTVQTYEIDKQHFIDMAEACRLDRAIVRYPTWKRLEAHSAGVAGSVAVAIGAVLGARHSESNRHAIALGNAVRLTNILRDIGRDWARGHVYLPLEDLARFRYSERDLAGGVVNDAFRELIRFQIDRARQLYRFASEGLCWLADDGSRLTAATIAVVSAGILDAIEQQKYDVFSSIARLTTSQQLRRMSHAWRLAKRDESEPLPEVFR